MLPKKKLLGVAACLLHPVAADDIMQNAGQFTSAAVLDKWSPVLISENYLVNVQDNYLELEKKEDAKGFFNDAYIFRTETLISPRNIHFEVWTDTADLESCGVQLYQLLEEPGVNDNVNEIALQKLFVGPAGPSGFTTVPNSHVFLFRQGFFNYMKLNVDSMVMMYEANRWYAIDLLINWEEQQVSIYVDEEPQAV